MKTLTSPLAISLSVHGAALVAVVLVALVVLPAPPSILRMHLVASSGSLVSETGRVERLVTLPTTTVSPAPVVSETVAWVATTSEISAAVSVPEPTFVPPAEWSELFGETTDAPALVLPLPTGWAKGTQTEGHEPPPLPPPGLIPPQGARWTVSFRIPAEGGFPLEIKGLDEGHSDLDSWLEAWLRDATFPPSVTGEAYGLKWILVLDVGRPE